MKYVTPTKGKHDYVIGIDFGHGETSADKCLIQWDENYLKLENPESIEIFNGVNAIQSILLVEKKDGEEFCFIGPQAVSRYSNIIRQNTANYSYYSCFKKAPSKMSLEERWVMKAFMREVYQQIRRQREELNDNNHVVYIACPSNSERWNEKEQFAYADIALEAGIPLARIEGQSIGIIRESRAAFIKARHNKTSKSSIKEGILLIDFGSSTVDLTYYSSKFTGKPIDDGGAECGASNVEIKIAKDLVKKEPQLEEIIRENKSAETAVLLAIREAKEDYYKCEECNDMEINLSLTKLTGGLKKGVVEWYYSRDDISTILTDYIAEIRKCFKKFRDSYLKEKPIKLIFMTGGASRMQFVQDIAREVFNYKAEFYKETNPSLTISNGIALAGRADLRSAALLEKLFNDKTIRNSSISSKVIAESVKAITDDVMTRVSLEYSSFANNSSDRNITSLENDILYGLKGLNYSSAISSKFGAVLREEVNKLILPDLNKVVGDYFPDGSIENISSTKTFHVSINVDSDAIAKLITDSVDSITEGLFEGVLKIAGSVAGLAVSGAAALGGALIGGIHDIFCKTGDEWKVSPQKIFDEASADLIPDWRDKNTKLNKDKRQTVLQRFNESKSSYETGIKDVIYNTLKDNGSLRAEIDKAFRDEINAYIREQVNKVRLMLN